MRPRTAVWTVWTLLLVLAPFNEVEALVGFVARGSSSPPEGISLSRSQRSCCKGAASDLRSLPDTAGLYSEADTVRSSAGAPFGRETRSCGRSTGGRRSLTRLQAGCELHLPGCVLGIGRRSPNRRVTCRAQPG